MFHRLLSVKPEQEKRAQSSGQRSNQTVPLRWGPGAIPSSSAMVVLKMATLPTDRKTVSFDFHLTKSSHCNFNLWKFHTFSSLIQITFLSPEIQSCFLIEMWLYLRDVKFTVKCGSISWTLIWISSSCIKILASHWARRYLAKVLT